ncbi:MAG: hypothetical protein WBQ14_01375 [Gaiellaceae bacterium]
MRMQRRFGLVVFAALVALAVSSVASATVIREGKGAGQARLGQIDTSVASLLGKHTGLQRDPNYGSRVVYVMDFGKKKAGRYPCEMLSNSTHHVFQFAFNSPAYVTARGIKVGSSEAALTAAYSGMKRAHTPKFDHYILGKRPYTDFWVLNSTRRVYQIIVRSK